MKVVEFTGITKNDIEVDKVLDGAKDCQEVLIVGWKNDELYVAASNGSISDALLLLELAKKDFLDYFG